MLLWIPIAIVTLVAIVLVARPLVRARLPAADGSRDDERRLAVFRDRRHEIERERQLAEDLPPVDAAPRPAGERAPPHAARLPDLARSGAGATRWTAAALAVLIPAVALGVYWQVGAPHLASGESGQTAAPIGAAQIEAMVDRVEERTRSHPEDSQAWAMLAQARKVQGRYAEAVAAYAQAVERIPGNARLLTDYAEASALLAGGDFRGQPIALLERALATDPREPKAIALMGAAQYRTGNLAQARSLLVRLEEFLEPGSDEAQQIATIVQQIDGEIAAGRADARTGANAADRSGGGAAAIRPDRAPGNLPARGE